MLEATGGGGSAVESEPESDTGSLEAFWVSGSAGAVDGGSLSREPSEADGLRDEGWS